jgi:hypothetical protein
VYRLVRNKKEGKAPRHLLYLVLQNANIDTCHSNEHAARLKLLHALQLRCSWPSSPRSSPPSQTESRDVWRRDWAHSGHPIQCRKREWGSFHFHHPLPSSPEHGGCFFFSDRGPPFVLSVNRHPSLSHGTGRSHLPSLSNLTNLHDCSRAHDSDSGSF